jgi:hypothetical protein
MCIIYKSVDDVVNNLLFLVYPSFFGDIYKFANEFINIKKELKNMFYKFINGMFFKLPEYYKRV